MSQPKTTPKPAITTTSSIRTSTIEPTDNPNGGNSTDIKDIILHDWAPYIITAAAIITLTFLFLCIFCKCFRDGIYWCFTCSGQCQCCHFVCCCRERPIETDPVGSGPYISRSSSQSNSGGRASSVPTRLPPISMHTAPLPTTYISSARASPSMLPSASRVPMTGISSMPMRQQLTETARKQKYIGSLLAMGRRPPPPLTTQPTTTTAPPAAKQVARTVKIIGDILVTDSNRKRKI